MLAPRLKIGGEEYEDLDEIISRRVSACNDLVNDLLASPKVTAWGGGTGSENGTRRKKGRRRIKRVF